jgi:hypothetical protein
MRAKTIGEVPNDGRSPFVLEVDMVVVAAPLSAEGELVVEWGEPRAMSILSRSCPRRPG